MRQIGDSVQDAYVAAQREEERLRSELSTQRRAALEERASAVEIAVLEHEVQVNQRLHQTVRERMKEMTVLSNVQASGVFLIDEAHVPQRPSHPKPALNLAGGLVAGLVIGLLLVFVIETVDTRVRSAEDVERYLELPLLGRVPDLEQLARQGQKTLIAPEHQELEETTSLADGPRKLIAAISGGRVPATNPLGSERLAAIAAEAYRSVRTSLLLSQAGSAPHSVMFTSTTNREGKTTTSINTALMYAQLPASVLLIDADLRRRQASRLLGIEKEPGLSELLTGQAESILPYHYGNATIDILPAGATPPHPTELLGSHTMTELLRSLRERYRYVVIDAPPLSPVSDALVLSTQVDGVVMVVDSRGAARQHVREAKNRLAKARAKLLGVVLNRAAPGSTYGYYSDYLDDPGPRRSQL